MVCSNALYDALAVVASSFLTVAVERFDFSRMDIADDVALRDLERGIAALGAAMRPIPWAA